NGPVALCPLGAPTAPVPPGALGTPAVRWAVTPGKVPGLTIGIEPVGTKVPAGGAWVTGAITPGGRVPGSTGARTAPLTAGVQPDSGEGAWTRCPPDGWP